MAELVEAITGHVHEVSTFPPILPLHRPPPPPSPSSLLLQLAVKHDMARVVQSCLKYGTPQLRTVLFNELRGTQKQTHTSHVP